MSDPIPVVGIGADGWPGLPETARARVQHAQVLLGSARQLDLVPAEATGAERVCWPSPLLPVLPDLIDSYRDRRVCVLASGDPMFYGIGVTLAKILGPQAIRVFPQPSSATLACARLGWPSAHIPVVSTVARPLETVLPELTHGRRLLVLSGDENTPRELAELLRGKGFGQSRLSVLEQLGGPAERIVDGIAADWPHAPGDRLNIVAIEAVRDRRTLRLTRIPGLPDAGYQGDGQLTKSEIRALSIAALAPAPGELLWDVGGGSGSIAIEWCRTNPDCRAVTFERSESRRDQIAANTTALGVPAIEVRGEFLTETTESGSPAQPPVPDAIFIGGGLTQPGLVDACWSRLRPGGRLVVNAVTAESEALLLQRRAEWGGALRKFQIYRGEPLGGFTAWRPHLPVAQWIVTKPADHHAPGPE
ncbi:MAG: precorrin-6y C5,15-methyltransferase (decarboxylating) subunit CbiE [Nocardia sp.]|nr:precorrin-6y C5,15-methyltransferase (decarboxylating) subunit CbiE [Nocardia sp.]